MDGEVFWPLSPTPRSARICWALPVSLGLRRVLISRRDKSLRNELLKNPLLICTNFRARPFQNIAKIAISWSVMRASAIRRLQKGEADSKPPFPSTLAKPTSHHTLYILPWIVLTRKGSAFEPGSSDIGRFAASSRAAHDKQRDSTPRPASQQHFVPMTEMGHKRSDGFNF